LDANDSARIVTDDFGETFEPYCHAVPLPEPEHEIIADERTTNHT
jgi:hypothetical protein